VADVRVLRVYDAVDSAGTKVLVDRLWPRGLRKDDPRFDVWLKEVAPTTELRTWYGHDEARYDEFVERYRAELASNAEAAEALERLRALAASGPVVLVTATRQVDLSHAAVLAAELSGAG